MKNILEALDVKKTYKVGKIDVAALRGVSIRVREGEFISIMGPSGCGKSTLLHILGGLAKPTSGKVIIDGEEISAVKDGARTDIRRRKIGFVFQRYNLLPTLTAQGNLQIARQIFGNGNRDEKHIQNVLKLLGLEKKVSHKPSEMSGGEQQRVAIARAVINKPAILLADEPTGNLDTENSQVVLSMLQELNRTFNQSIIMITHNPEAAAVGNRLIEMRDGCVVPHEHDVSFNRKEDTIYIQIFAENTEAAEVSEDERLNGITGRIIAAAIRVHRSLGPELLESAQEACTAFELVQDGLRVEQQKPFPLICREVKLSYRDQGHGQFGSHP